MTPSLSFSLREWTDLYVHRAFDDLSGRFLAILRHFEDSNYVEFDQPTQLAVDAFVLNFLHFFSKADYVPARAHAVEFIELNNTIANLVAASALKTTDPFLEVLRYQENSLAKVLALYSARNTIHLDPEAFFAEDPQLAAAWYVAYAAIFHGGLVRPDVCKNLQAHFAFSPSIFKPSDRLPDISYGASYADQDCERVIKPAVNRWIRASVRGTRIRNAPDPRKIAVLSCLWWAGQSSYRITAAYVEALRDYHLTLFHVPMAGKKIDTTHFRDVKELRFANGVLDIGPLLDNDFQVAFFPDVGMTSFSLWLANLRMAPIQVAATGHSVSTWDTEIDYYLSGADVERPDRPEQSYSERLVLLPGCGAIHQFPEYEPIGRPKTCPEFVLNCPWSTQKMNFELGGMLARIVERSQRKLRFRFFVGSMTRRLTLVPFIREVRALLKGAEVEVLANLNYQQYMALLEEGDLGLDAYHFGGCNTVADSLYLRKLMVCCEGSRWYNRIGPRMLRMVGVPELIATSPGEYIDLVVRLIHDDGYRGALEGRLRAANLQETIFSRRDARYVRKAIDYLIANHATLQMETDRSPIRIGRDPE